MVLRTFSRVDNPRFFLLSYHVTNIHCSWLFPPTLPCLSQLSLTRLEQANGHGKTPSRVTNTSQYHISAWSRFWPLSLPMSQSDCTTVRNAINRVKAKIKEWASLLLGWWFISSVLQWFAQWFWCTYFPIQSPSEGTGLCRFLTRPRRTKVDEVSGHPIPTQYLTLFLGSHSVTTITLSSNTCLVECIRWPFPPGTPSLCIPFWNWQTSHFLQGAWVSEAQVRLI